MIAAEHSKRVKEIRRIITPHLDAVLAQMSPESTRRYSQAAHPVVDQFYVNTLSGLTDQGLGK